MTALIPLDARLLSRKLKSRELTLIDIREPDEFAREHIEGAVSLPLSQLEAGHVALRGATQVAFTCKTGMRTNSNCERLAAHVAEPAFVLEGGLESWKRVGLTTVADRKAPIEIMRQVQILAGLVALLGAMLSAMHPAFIWLSAFLGAGLVLAGASGWSGMAKLLGLTPWNRKAT